MKAISLKLIWKLIVTGKKHIAKDRILRGSKKDNFWEMGDSGPADHAQKYMLTSGMMISGKAIDGASLVNMGDPLVIEIWNLVFMQYNRLANGSLQPLPAKHVDTGMGFERLCMVFNIRNQIMIPMFSKYY
jgi:alanyl-tRNA synthetase